MTMLVDLSLVAFTLCSGLRLRWVGFCGFRCWFAGWWALVGC